MEVEVEYNNGVKLKLDPSEYTITDGTALPLGKENITVSYTENDVTVTALQSITVIEKEVDHIEVYKLPDKTNYLVNDQLDDTGLIITVYYNNNTQENVSDGFSCSPNILTVAGTNQITVTYKNKQTTFELTALNPNITSDNYIIDDLKINKIQPNTNLTTFKTNIKTELNYAVFTKSGTELTASDIICTNMILKDELNREYTLIVIGDTNEDGDSNFRDILEINKHRLNIALFNGSRLEAANVNNDGTVDFRDILKINKFRLKIITEL